MDGPLLERAGELRLIDQAMERLAEGAGSLLLLEGPAGIGKTRLVAEAVARARRQDLLVRVGTGGELEREMPFGVARQLLEPVIARCSDDERARLLAGSAELALVALGRVDGEGVLPAGDPLAPIHGLYWLVANLTLKQPVVLAVDDAHWSDAQTLRFLDYLARRVHDLPVLVLVTVRSGEPDEPSALERLRLRAELLRPRSLSEAAVRELVAASLGEQAPAELATACARATGGNPFLVAEVLRALRGEHAGDDATASIARLAPDSVARHVLVRLGRFGDEATALARAVAALGGSTQLRHAAALSGLEEQRASELADRLREAEILRPGVPIDFVHPLVREAIARDLPDGRRSALHRRAAELLHATGAGAGEIAPHLLACAPNGDQWVVARLGEAAWEAIHAAAFDTARDYLQRALQEPPDDDLPVLFGVGRCMLQSDPVRAAVILRDVADRPADDRLRQRALRYAAHAHFLAGELNAGADCYARLLELLADDEREKRLLAEAEHYVFRTGRGHDDASSRRIEAVAAGLQGKTAGECVARQAFALDRFIKGAPVAEVFALATPFPPVPWALRTNISAGLCQALAVCGRWSDAREELRRIIDAAREAGAVVTQSYCLGILADVELLAGSLGDAEAEARTALEIAGEVASFLSPGRLALCALITTLIAQGRLDEAERLARGVDLSAGPRQVQVSPWPLEVRAYLRLARGQLHAAIDDLLEFGEAAESMGILTPAVPWRQEAAAPLAAVDRTAEAARLLRAAEERARVLGAPHVVGGVLRAKALLSPRSRRTRILQDSVAVLAQSGPPHELARSLVDLGATLRADRRRIEARAPLRRALDLAHRCRAGALEKRAREELAAAGVRPRRPSITGRDALTATEERVATLAASGMSNAQIAQSLFVSPKTVENHLGRIYGKLGINSRRQLGGALKFEGRSL